MTDTGDEQDRAETLDSDNLPGDPDDPDAVLAYPPEHLMGADQYGITAAEEEVDEPLEERLEREIPDPLAVELDEEVAEEDADVAGVSLEAELEEIEDELPEEYREAVEAIPELDPDA